MLAAVPEAETTEVAYVVLLLLGLVSLGFAVWRATLRDVVGTILLAVLGIVLLVLAT